MRVSSEAIYQALYVQGRGGLAHELVGGHGVELQIIISDFRPIRAT